MPTAETCPACGRHSPKGAERCHHCGAWFDAGFGFVADAPEDAAGPRYAGFWIRVGAFLIDGVPVGLILVAVFAIAPLLNIEGPLYTAGPTGAEDGGAGYAIELDTPGTLLLVGTAWLYETLLTASALQGTLGKRLLGLRVARDGTGAPLGFARATGRHFGKYISMIALAGFIAVAFTRRKQGIHDFLAETVVLRR